MVNIGIIQVRLSDAKMFVVLTLLAYYYTGVEEYLVTNPQMVSLLICV
jgi:hypothetical protein